MNMADLQRYPCSVKALHRQTRIELKQSLQYYTAAPFDIFSGACEKPMMATRKGQSRMDLS